MADRPVKGAVFAGRHEDDVFPGRPRPSLVVVGAGMAQLAERLIEKPGAVLTQVRVSGAARDFSPRVSFRC